MESRSRFLNEETCASLEVPQTWYPFSSRSLARYAPSCPDIPVTRAFFMKTGKWRENRVSSSSQSVTLPEALPCARHRSMKSAIIKRLPIAGLIYVLLSLLYFGSVGHYGHMY